MKIEGFGFYSRIRQDFLATIKDCAFILQIQGRNNNMQTITVNGRNCGYGKYIRPTRSPRARVILAHPNSIHPLKFEKSKILE
jgi:hypothetical protein